ncbi:MAG: di-heme oxidoredictase family protein [Pseudomonadota bacterium]
MLGVAVAALTACGQRPLSPLPAPGGEWTAPASVRATLIVPAQVLDSRAKLDFWTGMGFFRDPWVTAPASTTARDGLGPLFNAQSCIACHGGGGRGSALANDAQTVATVLRFGLQQDSEVVPHPRYGHQLQPRATYDAGTAERVGAYYSGEPKVHVAFETRDLAHRNGQSLSLRLPRYDTAALGDHVALSARIAPGLVGLGLLEAIPQERLEVLADPGDENGDGISGRVHWRDGRAGRFGWKALHPTVAQQTAAAFAQDIGISNPLVSDQNCTPNQVLCQSQVHGIDAKEKVEITRALFDRVVFFASHLGPPPAREVTPMIDRGRRAFADAGCDSCHTPSHRVALDAAAGGEQEIWPYTDLLLHDMGDALDDGLPEGKADSREWRTPPLWGLGYALAVNPDTGLLHDGRARNVAESIGWHDGEARKARERYLNMTAGEREALEAFVLAL